jgi:hypothetical protein
MSNPWGVIAETLAHAAKAAEADAANAPGTASGADGTGGSTPLVGSGGGRGGLGGGAGASRLDGGAALDGDGAGPSSSLLGGGGHALFDLFGTTLDVSGAFVENPDACAAAFAMVQHCAALLHAGESLRRVTAQVEGATLMATVTHGAGGAGPYIVVVMKPTVPVAPLLVD